MSRQLEGTAQTHLFQFFAHVQGQIPQLYGAFHGPNGGHRHIVVAQQLKAQGVKPGVPDILIPVPSVRPMDPITLAVFAQNTSVAPPANMPYIGLAIELKIGKNKPSDEQIKWQARFQQSGWRAVVCYGWEAAAKETIAYFGHDASKFYLF